MFFFFWGGVADHKQMSRNFVSLPTIIKTIVFWLRHYQLSYHVFWYVKSLSPLRVVSLNHLQRVLHAYRKADPSGHLVSSPFFGGLVCALIADKFSRLYINLLNVPNLTLNELRGSMEHLRWVWQGALTPPDTWFRPPFEFWTSLGPSVFLFWGTCVCSNYWDQFSRACLVFSLFFTFNTPRYFLDFPLCCYTALSSKMEFFCVVTLPV